MTSRQFKALDKDVLTQVDQIMANGERVIGRTQTKRADYAVIGRAEQVEEGDRDPEIFDDSDFYHDLLRQLSTFFGRGKTRSPVPVSLS